MSCGICEHPTFAEHPERGELCRVHALAVVLTGDLSEGPRARALLYEHAAAGRVRIEDENGPAFALTAAGELWALGEVAAWST